MAELVPIPFEKLLKRIYYEYERNDSIFDLPSRKFYRANPELDLSVSFCGNIASNPVGPAAGPHTQLAQNIILSWLAGARMLELKTVQLNDRLQLSRPCIDITTIGYNTEWSQELLLDESLREYVKASMLVEILEASKILSEEHRAKSIERGEWNKEIFNSNPTSQIAHLKPRTVFDISVGYDLHGIQSKEIRAWLNVMKNASTIIGGLRKEIPDEFSSFRNFDFKTEIGNSITLSTFHGTPANEIERICEFLLCEMDFNVIIKMNPPMLGKEKLEHLLFEKLGYTNVEVNPKVYDVNISFADAIDVVKCLQTVAAKKNKTIGVKFGNTLEVFNKGNFLKENVQYLSGQPLHVLHLALVNEWRKIFSGEFPVSFSAGVDANNFADCVAIGLVPITTCTDLLRPGGYGRLPQYLLNLERRMKDVGAKTIDEFIVKSNYELRIRNYELGSGELATRNSQLNTDSHTSHIPHRTSAIIQNTTLLIEKSITNPRYHFSSNYKPPRKIGSHLVLFDCISCDKCIPVCPNDANFYFEIEPTEIHFNNIEIANGSWKEIDGGIFSVKDKHQIANFADACNECGNCDVFCPEDGGPYIEKPRFFGS
ncbi:MAG: glutamate synthase, partial [Ignavibacteria bacterium]|nr:glutamate synthase [Ignavibacteria bacterium]